MEKFHCLTLPMAIADHKAGKLTTYGLLDYYVRIKANQKRVRKIPPSPKEVCLELDISMPQFRRAIAKLRADPHISSRISYTHINYCFGSPSR